MASRSRSPSRVTFDGAVELASLRLIMRPMLTRSGGVAGGVDIPLARRRGAIIKDIVRIERPEKTHFLFEDADFSVATIKKLIRQGEEDTDKALATKNWNQ